MQRNERFAIAAGENPESIGEPEPDLPPYADYLLELFGQLQALRNPETGLTWADIGQWSKLTGTNISPLEASYLVTMESALKTALAKERQELNERLKDKRGG